MNNKIREEIKLLAYLLTVLFLIFGLVFVKNTNAKIQNIDLELTRLEEDLHRLQVIQSVLREDRQKDLQMIIPMWKEYSITYLDTPIEVEEVPEIKEIVANSNDLTIKSNVTIEHLQKTLNGTALSGLEKYYIQAEEESGINAIFLCALSIHESGWGKSNFAKTRNNLFGLKAYNHNPNNASSFSSKGENILYAGNYIYTNYLEPSGKYHSGTSIESINKRYAVNKDGSPNYHWSQNIKKLMTKIEGGNVN